MEMAISAVTSSFRVMYSTVVPASVVVGLTALRVPLAAWLPALAFAWLVWPLLGLPLRG